LLVLRHAGDVSPRRRTLAALEPGAARQPGRRSADRRGLRRKLEPPRSVGGLWRPRVFDRAVDLVPGSLLPVSAALSGRRHRKARAARRSVTELPLSVASTLALSVLRSRPTYRS